MQEVSGERGRHDMAGTARDRFPGASNHARFGVHQRFFDRLSQPTRSVSVRMIDEPSTGLLHERVTGWVYAA
jgi:hypothetical protein